MWTDEGTESVGPMKHKDCKCNICVVERRHGTSWWICYNCQVVIPGYVGVAFKCCDKANLHNHHLKVGCEYCEFIAEEVLAGRAKFILTSKTE